MLNIKSWIVKTLVSDIKISDVILITASNAIKENDKQDNKITSKNKQKEVSK